MIKSNFCSLRKFRAPAILLVLLAIVLAATTSCSHDGSSISKGNTIAVQMDSILIQDSLTDQNGIKVTMSYTISYPKSIKDSKAETAKFSKLLAKLWFSNDSLDLAKSANAALSEGLKAYSSSSIINAEDIQDEDVAKISRYDIDQNIAMIYHNCDLAIFKKSSTTKKDGKASLSNNTFFTIDLSTIKPVTLADIFDENNYATINDALKKQLLTKNNCSNSDQLAEVGYFNIDNLSINDNFTVDEKGISFHYNPLEIACYAVGEVVITLPFEDIKESIKTDSPICRLIKQ